MFNFLKHIFNNIYYVENKDYQNEKLNKLVEIKNELENNNLLIKNDNFKEYINDKKIVIYGYQYIEKKYRKLLEKLGAIYIEEDTTYNNQKLYEFKTKEGIKEIDKTAFFVVTDSYQVEGAK